MKISNKKELEECVYKQIWNSSKIKIKKIKVHGGKAFPAEQKIREFKKILVRSKRFEKNRRNRIKPNLLIKKAAQNMNETIRRKYQLAPDTIEKKSLNPNDRKYFQEG